MRKQLLDLTGSLRRQPRQNIFEISIRIMPIDARGLDQAHDCSRPLAAAQRPSKQPVRLPKPPRPDQVLDLVVVDGHSTILQVARQRCPAFKAVIQGPSPRAQVRVGPASTHAVFQRWAPPFPGVIANGRPAKAVPMPIYA